MLLRRSMLLGGLCLAATGVAHRAGAQPKNPAWPKALNMGTVAPGGTYAMDGPAWGPLVQDATGVNIS